ncbi:DUF3592 domain-containing protein [Roseateles amylovorans]|uniref:DUF3592 domain-containing protein n=1 Tax=Roseateles amylovorans TaxID=2978473 RepID=A0ABY6ASH5_9BURK|nr:DUF3592 domain-containing protein [Roseateles amylovorans]UXH76186.1 DUF3592 domain-containing protein [Roseateles amylovorans]
MWRWMGCCFFVGAGLLYVMDTQRRSAGPTDLQPVAAVLEQGRCEPVERATSPGKTPLYYAKPVLSYRYEAGGRTYHGQRYARRADATFSTSAECEAYVASLAAGPSVTAWVSASEPAYSVLEPAQPKAGFGYVFILIGSLFGLAAAWSQIKKWRSAV